MDFKFQSMRNAQGCLAPRAIESKYLYLPLSEFRSHDPLNADTDGNNLLELQRALTQLLPQPHHLLLHFSRRPSLLDLNAHL